MAAAKGEVVSAVATGELTINGVTNTVEIPVEARLVDAKILVTGSTATFSTMTSPSRAPGWPVRRGPRDPRVPALAEQLAASRSRGQVGGVTAQP